MTVGQAHMLDDIISLVRVLTWCPSPAPHPFSFVFRQLELDDPDGPSIFQRVTLSYGLGEHHGLFTPMKAAQLDLSS
jgi:m7GpppX diphosphatase